MAQRLSVFIDGSNLYHILKEVHGRTDLDFHAFVNLFGPSPKGERSLNPVHYYNSIIDRGRYPRTYARQQRFYANLQKIQIPSFIIYRGRIEHHGDLKYKCRGCEDIISVSEQICPNCGLPETLQDSVEKGVDVSLAVDMVEGAYNNEYDVCLLVSEDSDFVPALKAVKKMGKITELAVLTHKTRRRGYHLIKTVHWTHYVQPQDLTWLRAP